MMRLYKPESVDQSPIGKRIFKYLENDGREVGSDLVIGDCILGGSLVQTDFEEQFKALLRHRKQLKQIEPQSSEM